MAVSRAKKIASNPILDTAYAEQWHLTRLGDIETIWDEYTGKGLGAAASTG